MQARYTLPRHFHFSWGLDLEWTPNMLALVRETRKATQRSPELPHLPVPPALKEAEAPESAVIDSACVGQCTLIGWLGFVVDGRERQRKHQEVLPATLLRQSLAPAGQDLLAGRPWPWRNSPLAPTIRDAAQIKRTTSPIQPPALPTQQHKEPMVLPLKK